MLNYLLNKLKLSQSESSYSYYRDFTGVRRGLMTEDPDVKTPDVIIYIRINDIILFFLFVSRILPLLRGIRERGDNRSFPGGSR